MNYRNTIVTAVSVLGCALGMVPLTSEAATNRITYRSATNACHVVDPTNEAGLRYRNLGIFNASMSSMQVACSLDTELVADNAATDLTLSIHNFRTAATTINCTAFGGNRNIGTNSYPATINLGPQATTSHTFQDIDRVTPGSYAHISVVCVLPPNVELSTLRLSENAAANDL